MITWFNEVQAGLGRRLAWVSLIAVAVGVFAFVSGLVMHDAPRTFGSLIASWLFFAGAAAGALAFRAFFHIVDARWARPLTALGAYSVRFTPIAIVGLMVILAGAALAPWMHAEGVWLRTPLLVLRQVALFAVLFGFAYAKLGPGARQPSTATAVVYCLLFAVVLSVWAFDFVIGPDPAFQSTIIGPYVFMSAFTAGTGFLALRALHDHDLHEKKRRDMGSFMLALSIFWGYLFWSQYLTIWYGNLPDEVAFALRRDGFVVLAIVLLVFAVPFVTLLHPKGRSSARVLRVVLTAQLVGLWLSCHALVVPSLASSWAPALELRDILIAVGVYGAGILSVARAPQVSAVALAAE